MSSIFTQNAKLVTINSPTIHGNNSNHLLLELLHINSHQYSEKDTYNDSINSSNVYLSFLKYHSDAASKPSSASNSGL